jgi:hypothetical protein
MGIAAEVSADAYPSLQAAIDANPGRMIRLVDREYIIDRSLLITTSGTGLCGEGVIKQTHGGDSIVRIENADDVRVLDVTLCRPADRGESTEDGLRATGCKRLTIRNIRVVDNWSLGAGIRIDASELVRIDGCEIRNYKRVGIEDRTANPDYGFAFHAILGDGIIITRSKHTSITSNRIVEDRLLAIESTAREMGLGKLVSGRAPVKKGKLAPKGDETPLWHQGSAIVITSPEETSHAVVTGNIMVRAAQGVDIHADQVVFANNVIDNSLIGIKCMHGSKNVVISGNNVSRASLWGLVMMPGTASHGASTVDGQPVRANWTSGNVIAHNVFSRMGEGDDAFHWLPTGSIRAISIEAGPDDRPPVVDVVIQGNIVYDDSQEEPSGASPKFQYALMIDHRLDRSRMQIIGNILPKGREGSTNWSD